jgi:hypothetical protein
VRALSIADVLTFLGGLNRKGLLTVAAEGTVVDLFLDAGRVTYANSTRDTDRLADLLLRWELIEKSQHDAAMALVAAGGRLARALVESGALRPKELIQARERQVKQITLSVFEWRDGEFHFLEGEDPQGELPPVDLPIPELVAEGIRAARDLDLIRERLPSSEWVYETIADPGAPALEVRLQPQESYVLGLVNGVRSINDIAVISGFPDLEVRRILFLLFTLGRLKSKAQPGPEAVDRKASVATAEVVRRFNSMFGHLHRYLMREVGPISEHLLERSLRQAQGTHPALFSRSSLGGDGTLDAGVLTDNLRGLQSERRQELLMRGLNQFLSNEILTLRRTLGAEHEKRVLKVLRRDPGFRESGIQLGA